MCLQDVDRCPGIYELKKKKTTNVMTGNTNGDVFERDRILKERERR